MRALNRGLLPQQTTDHQDEQIAGKAESMIATRKIDDRSL
jgi:hypothetical protein